jgi:hypothetical protein
MVSSPYSEMSRNDTPGERTVLAAPFGVHDTKPPLPHVDYTPHKHMTAHTDDGVQNTSSSSNRFSSVLANRL